MCCPAPVMPQPKTPLDVKHKVSATLLDLSGVSGVGVRDDGVVIYLEADNSALRRKAARIVEAVSPTTPVAFEVTGGFEKQ